MLNYLGSGIEDRKSISLLFSVSLYPCRGIYTHTKSHLFYKLIIVMPSNGVSTCMIVTLPVRKFKNKINKNV